MAKKLAPDRIKKWRSIAGWRALIEARLAFETSGEVVGYSAVAKCVVA